MTAPGPRLSELLEAYLREVPSRGTVSEHSTRAMRSSLRRFVESTADRPASTLKRSHVERWLAECAREDVVPETICTRLKHVRNWCRWMLAAGFIEADPTASIKGPRRPGRRNLRQPRPIDDAEIARLLRTFRVYQLRQNLAARTVAGRQRTLVLFGVHIAPKSMVDATVDDIEGWLDSCAIGVGSRHTYLAAVRAFFVFVCDHEGTRPDNPADRIPLPRLNRRMPRPIPDHQLRAALTGADPRMRAWLLLGALAGFRAKEMAGLRREDILDGRDPPMLLVSSPKGGHERLVPLNPILEHALRVHGVPARGYVFHLDDGRPMRAETVSCYIGKYLRSLDIDASGHQTRHHFGTNVYAASKDIRLTQEMLGHADPKSTAIYAAWNATNAAEVVRGLSIG